MRVPGDPYLWWAGVGEVAYLVWPDEGGVGLSSGQFRGRQTAGPTRGEVVSGSLG